MDKPASTGERLRTERERRGLGQTEVAAQVGISQGELSRIENDERQKLRWSVVKGLERVLGISLDYPEPHPSLVAFLEHHLGKGLKIDAEEEAELVATRWFGAGDPTPEEWFDFVRLRRDVIKRRGGA